MKPDGRGHLKPGLARGHTGGHIRAANTGGEGAQSTVGAGVAVGTDDAVTGGNDPLLRQEGVLNAHLAHVVKVADAVVAGKFPAGLALLGGLDVLVGHKVVQNDDHLVLVVDPFESGLSEFVHRHRGGDVVAQDDVQLGLDQLPGGNLPQPGVGRQDLLCHCHCHNQYYPPLFPVRASP